MDQCCGNVGNVFVLCLQSVMCRKLQCTVLKVFACLISLRAVFPKLFCPWNPPDLKYQWNQTPKQEGRLCTEHNGERKTMPL